MEVLVPFITIKSYAFLNCKNLQKMNLSESSVYCLEEGSFGNCYNLEYVILSKKTKNIHVMIRSEIRFISRELVEKALLPCVLSNFNLLENRYTEDALLPIQVYIEVMFFEIIDLTQVINCLKIYSYFLRKVHQQSPSYYKG